MTIHEEGYRWAKPGTVSEAACRVCATPCTITVNVLGPTNFASAIAKRHTLHDRIRCPRSGEDWHNDAVILQRAIDAMPSARVAAIMQLDFDELVARGLAGVRCTSVQQHDERDVCVALHPPPRVAR